MQDGKDFTIYIGKDQDNPQFMTYFTQLIEHNFLKNGIRPAPQIGYNILMGDKPIKGSIYGSYRYPVNENGDENPRHQFIPPRSGDIMTDVVVSHQTASTMTHVMTLKTKEEANATSTLLNNIGIDFSIQKNNEDALKQNPNLPPYKLFHKAPKSIQMLLNLTTENSFKNVFSEEIENTDQSKRVQLILQKIGLPSHRILPASKDKETKRIIFCEHNNLIQDLMKNIKIDHISEIDAALVYSKEEANRLWEELNKHNIPASKAAYIKKDGIKQYSIVYKKDAKTDKILRNLNANFIDEKNPNYSLRGYEQRKGQRIV